MKLKEKDRKKLVELYERAQTTPCIIVAPGFKDAATQAWDDVAKFLDDIGDKYGFDPRKMKGIDNITGEVVL